MKRKKWRDRMTSTRHMWTTLSYLSVLNWTTFRSRHLSQYHTILCKRQNVAIVILALTMLLTKTSLVAMVGSTATLSMRWIQIFQWRSCGYSAHKSVASPSASYPQSPTPHAAGRTFSDLQSLQFFLRQFSSPLLRSQDSGQTGGYARPHTIFQPFHLCQGVRRSF